ncbi:acyl-CoA carboxylase subunit epsilon, partial [Streptomyces sp. CHB9.2]|uniref:acyl-CoA carboxylase subunit epsilon n=1 Tax=Streptomyces sp. CHB9.2 TaxID=2841670 RepID=UPI00209431E6
MATPTVPATPEQFLRVEKGHAEPEELAAITALLMARAARQPSPAPTSRWPTPSPGPRAGRSS